MLLIYRSTVVSKFRYSDVIWSLQTTSIQRHHLFVWYTYTFYPLVFGSLQLSVLSKRVMLTTGLSSSWHFENKFLRTGASWLNSAASYMHIRWYICVYMYTCVYVRVHILTTDSVMKYAKMSVKTIKMVSLWLKVWRNQPKSPQTLLLQKAKHKIALCIL